MPRERVYTKDELYTFLKILMVISLINGMSFNPLFVHCIRLLYEEIKKLPRSPKPRKRRRLEAGEDGLSRENLRRHNQDLEALGYDGEDEDQDEEGSEGDDDQIEA